MLGNDNSVAVYADDSSSSLFQKRDGGGGAGKGALKFVGIVHDPRSRSARRHERTAEREADLLLDHFHSRHLL
jgi:hypothetical protein